jgi:hypothetical protein
VQSERKKGRQTLIIVVCERGEMLASGCAVARAFPTYSSKTPSTPPQTVTVGFIVVGGGASPVTDDDIKCLSAECEGIRLAAEIVDAPTNEMHTDIFIEVMHPPSVVNFHQLLSMSLSLSLSENSGDSWETRTGATSSHTGRGTEGEGVRRYLRSREGS